LAPVWLDCSLPALSPRQVRRRVAYRYQHPQSRHLLRFWPARRFAVDFAAAAGVRLNDAGINGKTFIASQPCLHAPDPHVFEQAAEQRALAKRASVAVLGKRRMIRGRGFKAQSAKPAVREIEVHLLAKPPLGPDAVAIADERHSDHQFRVHRGFEWPARFKARHSR
jgi:hypothetical protein